MSLLNAPIRYTDDEIRAAFKRRAELSKMQMEAQMEVFSPDTDVPGMMGTVAAHAARNAIPTGAGFLGAVKGAAIGAPLGPIGTAGGALIGGLGLGFGAGLVQDWVAPKVLGEDTFESYEDYLARSQEAHPLASFVGGVAPAAAFLRPTLAAPKALSRMFVKVPGSPISPASKAILLNSAASAAVETGIEGANQYATGQFSPERLAAAAAFGTFFTQPWGLGPKIGLEPLPTFGPKTPPITGRQVPPGWSGEGLGGVTYPSAVPPAPGAGPIRPSGVTTGGFRPLGPYGLTQPPPPVTPPRGVGPYGRTFPPTEPTPTAPSPIRPTAVPEAPTPVTRKPPPREPILDEQAAAYDEYFKSLADSGPTDTEYIDGVTENLNRQGGVDTSTTEGKKVASRLSSEANKTAQTIKNRVKKIDDATIDQYEKMMSGGNTRLRQQAFDLDQQYGGKLSEASALRVIERSMSIKDVQEYRKMLDPKIKARLQSEKASWVEKSFNKEFNRRFVLYVLDRIQHGAGHIGRWRGTPEVKFFNFALEEARAKGYFKLQQIANTAETLKEIEDNAVRMTWLNEFLHRKGYTDRDIFRMNETNPNAFARVWFPGEPWSYMSLYGDAKATSPIHEAFHHWIDWIRGFGNAKQVRYMSEMYGRMQKILEGKLGRPIASFDELDEFVVETLAKELSERTKEKGVKSEPERFWSALKAKVKSLFGGGLDGLSDKEVYDLLTYQGEFDQPFVNNKLPGFVPAVPRDAARTDLDSAPITSKDQFKLSDVARKLFRSDSESLRDRIANTVSEEAGNDAQHVMESWAASHRMYRGDLYSRLNDLYGKYLPKTGMAKTTMDLLQKNPTSPAAVSLGKVTKFMDYAYGASEDALYGRPNPVPLESLTPNEQEMAKGLMAIWKDIGANRNVRSTQARTKMKKGEVSEFFIPRIIGRDIYQVLSQEPGSIKGKQLRKQFIKVQKDRAMKMHGATEEEALKLANENFGGLLENIRQLDSPDIGPDFGPLTKAGGLGIPDSWVESNPFRRLNRSMERVARAFAYDDLMNNPLYNKMYDTPSGEPWSLDKIMSGTEEFKRISRYMLAKDENPGAAQVAENFNLIGRAIVLGPLTGAVDLANAPFLTLQHVRGFGQFAKAWAHSVQNTKQYYKEATAQGVIRDIGKLETLVGATTEASQAIRVIRDQYNSLQGRNFLEGQSRALTYGVGRYIADDFTDLYFQGTGKVKKEAETFLRRFGRDQFENMIKRGDKKFTQAELQEIAARFTEEVQGTYDFRDLPGWAYAGPLSPLVGLLRWNIGQMVKFNRNIVQAAMQGNFKPAVFSLMGLPIAGGVIESMRTLATGTERKQPSWEEIVAAKGMDAQTYAEILTYKFLGLAAATGLVGWMSELLRGFTDVTLYKAAPQDAIPVPAFSMIANTIADASQLVTAALERELDPMDTVDLALDWADNNIQSFKVIMSLLSRYGAAETIGGPFQKKKEDIERRGRGRDLRTYRFLSGYPLGPQIPLRSNVAVTEEQEFKRTTDLEEAGGLAQRAMQRAQNLSPTPQAMASRMEGLKDMPITWMPSESSEALNYLNWFTKTRGPEAGKALMATYLQQVMANRMKQQLIPKVGIERTSLQEVMGLER